MRKIGDKKAAIEMSIGTIVVIVIAMTMLILGLILVRSIFTGATYNVNTMNDKVRDEISKLFVEDKKTVVYLAGQEAKIKQGETWGIAFGIKNLETGVTGDKKFHYLIRASDPTIATKCGFSEAVANSWMITGNEGTIAIASGDTYYGLVRFNIPAGTSLCTIRYNLEVEFGSEPYFTDFFDVTVKPK